MKGVWYDSLRFSVDWVNVTVDCPSITEFIDSLSSEVGLDPIGWDFMDGNGFHWYANRVSYSTAGRAAITLSYSLLDDGTIPVDCSVIMQHGILVSISGDGCRYLEKLGAGTLQKFLRVCIKYPCNCTRFDVAMDIFEKDNPIIPLFTEFAFNAFNYEPDGHVMLRGNFRRTDTYCTRIPVRDIDAPNFETYNVYIGDRNATKGQCCVYNKKIEVKTGRLKSMAQEIFDSVGCTDYWYRVEYRAKNFTLANGAFYKACQENASILDIFYFIAENMFEFVDLSTDLGHISRCEVSVVWSEFLAWCESNLQNAHFVELVQTPHVDTNVDRLVNYMRRNAVMFSRFIDILSKFPTTGNMIYSIGLSKRESIPRYRSFEEEFALKESIAV